MYVMMKKFSIVLSLAFFLCLATVTSFAQSAAAGVSLNLKSMSCPNVQDGYERTHLEWKSHDYGIRSVNWGKKRKSTGSVV